MITCGLFGLVEYNIKGVFGLAYLSLSIGISTYNTVWKSLLENLMTCLYVVYKLARIPYENSL